MRCIGVLSPTWRSVTSNVHASGPEGISPLCGWRHECWLGPHSRGRLLRTIRGGGDPSRNMVIEPFVRMGPLPRSPAAEAHGCFMVRTPRGSNRIQGCGARFARTGGLPSVRCSAALSRSASKVRAGCPR